MLNPATEPGREKERGEGAVGIAGAGLVKRVKPEVLANAQEAGARAGIVMENFCRSRSVGLRGGESGGEPGVEVGR